MGHDQLLETRGSALPNRMHGVSGPVRAAIGESLLVNTRSDTQPEQEVLDVRGETQRRGRVERRKGRLIGDEAVACPQSSEEEREIVLCEFEHRAGDELRGRLLAEDPQ